MRAIKKIFLPFQIVLLNRRLCPGCTHPLDKLGNRSPFRSDKSMVQCKCKRRYIQDMKSGLYRRASLEEEREFLNKSRNFQ